MKTIQDHYQDAKAYLERYGIEAVVWRESNDKATHAEINLDSVSSVVAKELDSGSFSKTALRDAVKGDDRVLKAKAEHMKACLAVEVSREKMKFLDMSYTLEKKMIDALIKQERMERGF